MVGFYSGWWDCLAVRHINYYVWNGDISHHFLKVIRAKYGAKFGYPRKS